MPAATASARRWPASSVVRSTVDSAEPDAGHLVEQLGPLLEAVGDRPGQGGDALQGRGQVAGRQARLAVEGEQALAAAAAEVVGAAVADRAHEADGVCGRCEWNSAAWPQCGQVTPAPS